MIEGNRCLQIIIDNTKNMGELIYNLLRFPRLNKQELNLQRLICMDG